MRFFLQRSIDGDLWTTIWTHHNLSFAKRGIYWYKRSTRLKWKYRVVREDQV